MGHLGLFKWPNTNKQFLAEKLSGAMEAGVNLELEVNNEFYWETATVLAEKCTRLR